MPTLNQMQVWVKIAVFESKNNTVNFVFCEKHHIIFKTVVYLEQNVGQHSFTHLWRC